MTFKILDHPGDVKFRTNGETLEGAFTEVVSAVSELVGGPPESNETVTKAIKFDARTLEALLFDFLNQLILFQDIENVVVIRADELVIESSQHGYHLSATFYGNRIPSDEALFDLKAPTYSQMLIDDNDGWTIEAVIDV